MAPLLDVRPPNTGVQWQLTGGGPWLARSSAQYRPGKPAALMVFEDGPSVYLDLLKTPWVLDHLIHQGEITPDENSLRSMEYDTLDDTYARFVLDEILPAVVLRHYTIVNEPDGWAIAGQSSGGIAAFTVAWHRPDRFHKVLTQNGSFANIRGGNVYPDLIRQTAAKPLRILLLSGLPERVALALAWL
jgi:enterochelin esterase family protein